MLEPVGEQMRIAAEPDGPYGQDGMLISPESYCRIIKPDIFAGLLDLSSVVRPLLRHVVFGV